MKRSGLGSTVTSFKGIQLKKLEKEFIKNEREHEFPDGLVPPASPQPLTKKMRNILESRQRMNVTYTGAKQDSQSPFGARRSDSPESPVRSVAAKVTEKTPNSVNEDSSDNSSLD